MQEKTKLPLLLLLLPTVSSAADVPSTQLKQCLDAAHPAKLDARELCAEFIQWMEDDASHMLRAVKTLRSLFVHSSFSLLQRRINSSFSCFPS